MTRVPIWTVCALIFGASPAFAQAERPPVELGLGISGVATSGDDNKDDIWSPLQPPGAHIRVTVPVSARFALEGGMSAAIHSKPHDRRVVGYYAFQVKQRLAASGSVHPFVTYGVAGWYRAPNFPGWSNHLEPPWLAVVGGGLEQELGSHVSVRADAQLLSLLWLPLGVRYAASISIPLGRYDRR